jgi:hypothetical protein
MSWAFLLARCCCSRLGLPDDYPLQPSPHWSFNGQSLKALYEAVHDGGE